VCSDTGDDAAVCSKAGMRQRCALGPGLRMVGGGAVMSGATEVRVLSGFEKLLRVLRNSVGTKILGHVHLMRDRLILRSSPFSLDGRHAYYRRISHFIEKGDELIVALLTFDLNVRCTTSGCVSFHLLSSNTISMFSTTLCIIPHIHQILNPHHTTRPKISNCLGSPLPTSSPVWILCHRFSSVTPTRGEEGIREKQLLVFFSC
jgi:hypothetical protein